MPRDVMACRSWLFVPGDSPRKLERCGDAGADALIIDLEDAVAFEAKAASRRTCAAAIAAAGARRGSVRVFVRVNSVATGLLVDDLQATFGSRPDGYVIPKVESAEDVRLVSAILRDLETGAGVPVGATELIPIATETPAPVFRLPEICGADPRVRAIVWGTEDLSAAIGARRVKRPDGTMLDVFRTVRSLALLAGAAAGIGIIDTPVVEIQDHDRLRAESIEASWMGFTGKLAIHPAQVPIINQGFTPEDHEVEHARALVRAAQDAGAGTFRFAGKMIDAPHVKTAERLLARAEAGGA